jgi:hypothetical protein
MNMKLLFGAAALAAFATASTPTLAQPAGCMGNCPGTNLPSTTGQGSDRAQQLSVDEKTRAGQSNATRKPATSPQTSNPDSRGKRGK